METLKDIEEKLLAGVDHYTAEEVMFLLNQLAIVSNLLVKEQEKSGKRVDPKEIGQVLRKQAQLTLIQGGLQ